MNAQQIADRLVDRGIGVRETDGEFASIYYHNPTDYAFTRDPMSADEFISDWRTAGACLEACIGATISETEIDSGYGRGWEVSNLFVPGTNVSGGQDYKYVTVHGQGKSLPATICEAFCAAFAEVET